jgi:hypothetical protein
MIFSLQYAVLKPPQENRIRALESELGCRIIALQESRPPADLTVSQLSLLQLIEKAMDVALVAYSPARSLRVVAPSPEHLARLRELERETGYVLVAHAPEQNSPDVQAFSPGPEYEEAPLSEEQFSRLQTTEDEMNLVLMAYKHKQ